MKILVMSDSHGNTKAMEEAVKREQPDQVFHLGDYEEDCETLRRLFPFLPVRAVRGNCDMGSCEDTEALLTTGGKKFLLTHGHRYRVKGSTEYLESAAVCEGVDVALYGHTHRQESHTFSGIWIINPGSIGLENCYCVLEIRGEALEVLPKML